MEGVINQGSGLNPILQTIIPTSGTTGSCDDTTISSFASSPQRMSSTCLGSPGLVLLHMGVSQHEWCLSSRILVLSDWGPLIYANYHVMSNHDIATESTQRLSKHRDPDPLDSSPTLAFLGGVPGLTAHFREQHCYIMKYEKPIVGMII